MIKTKYILFGAGTLAALYGASYLLKLNRLSNELETVTKASIHKVSLQGIDLRIEVTLKNPSGGLVLAQKGIINAKGHQYCFLEKGENGKQTIGFKVK